MRFVLPFLGLCLFFASQTIHGQVPSCCAVSESIAFADFASDREFAEQHDVPLAYFHDSEVGKQITFNVAGGKDANAYVLRTSEPSDKWLIVVHEWWGLNEYIKKESEHLYHDLKDVNVLALDLYDGKVAGTRDQAASYMQAMEKDRARAIINGALKLIGESARVATIGWCFGGGWSLQTSIAAEKQGVACVVYYGMPEKDIEQLKKLGGPVLGIFANNEKWITPAVVNRFTEDMKKAGKELIVKRYDADHAFANPSSERYNSQAARDAYVETMSFLQKQFQ